MDMLRAQDQKRDLHDHFNRQVTVVSGRIDLIMKIIHKYSHSNMGTGDEYFQNLTMFVKLVLRTVMNDHWVVQCFVAFCTHYT